MATVPGTNPNTLLEAETGSRFEGAPATSFDDAKNGQICSFLGVWVPASMVVWVDGSPYMQGFERYEPEFSGEW